MTNEDLHRDIPDTLLDLYKQRTEHIYHWRPLYLPTNTCVKPLSGWLAGGVNHNRLKVVLKAVRSYWKKKCENRFISELMLFSIAAEIKKISHYDWKSACKIELHYFHVHVHYQTYRSFAKLKLQFISEAKNLPGVEFTESLHMYDINVGRGREKFDFNFLIIDGTVTRTLVSRQCGACSIPVWCHVRVGFVVSPRQISQITRFVNFQFPALSKT